MIINSDTNQILDVALIPIALHIQLLKGPDKYVVSGTEPTILVEITSGSEDLLLDSPSVFYRYDEGPFHKIMMDPNGVLKYTSCYIQIFSQQPCDRTNEHATPPSLDSLYYAQCIIANK